MALDLCQNFVSAQYLENKLTEFYQILYVHLYWQVLAWNYYTLFFAHLYQSYGPWFMPNFTSAQYLENKLTEFHQILYMHSYYQDLARDFYTLFFAHLYQSYGPRFMPKFCFRLISGELFDRISPNFIYAFILTRSTWVLSNDIFLTFVPALWSLIYAKIRFRSISWEQTDIILPNFIYAFILTRSMLGLSHIIFRTFVPELWPLIYSKISFPLNILRTNGQILTKLYTDKIYVGIVSGHLFQFCKSYGPWLMSELRYHLIYLRRSGLLLHAKHCSLAIVRLSDNSSLL